MLKNKALKNASIYGGMAFIQKSISFFLVPLYTTLLSPSEFGIVNQTIALGSIYILIFTYALDEASARMYFQHRDDEKLKGIVLGSIFILSTSLCFIGGLSILILSKYSYHLFVPEIPDNFIYLSVLIIITSPVYSIYQKILRIREDAKVYAFLMLGYSITQIVLSICFLVFVKLNSLGYILALSLTSAIFGIYSFFMINKEIKLKLSKPIAVEAFKYASSIVPHTISGWGLRGFTILALGKFLNSSLVGIFNAINFIAVLINVFSKSILDAYQPWVYKKLEQGASGVKSVIAAAHILGLLFVAMGFFLSLFSKEIIQLFINKQYHSGIYIAPILVFSSIVLALGSLLVFILYYYKEKAKFIGIATIIGSIINILLCLILIPAYGIMGGAIALAIANIIISMLKQFFASKALATNVLFFDLYFWAVLNLIISYIFIKTQVNISYKVIVFIIESLILLLIYHKSLFAMKQLLLNNKQ